MVNMKSRCFTKIYKLCTGELYLIYVLIRHSTYIVLLNFTAIDSQST